MRVMAMVPAQDGADLGSLYDMVLSGGPLMIPLALCSVVAFAFAVERLLRLRSPHLSPGSFGPELLNRVKSGGAEQGLALCRERPSALARVMEAGLSRAKAPGWEREKAVEDTGAREVRRLSANLRPLVVVAMIAPLLGLLGTVWGMIEAFANIALKDGLGKPELLASGISQALITTATGLAIAIPVQALYFWFKSRIERFVQRTEDLYQELDPLLESGGGAA